MGDTLAPVTTGSTCAIAVSEPSSDQEALFQTIRQQVGSIPVYYPFHINVKVGEEHSFPLRGSLGNLTGERGAYISLQKFATFKEFRAWIASELGNAFALIHNQNIPFRKLLVENDGNFCPLNEYAAQEATQLIRSLSELQSIPNPIEFKIDAPDEINLGVPSSKLQSLLSGEQSSYQEAPPSSPPPAARVRAGIFGSCPLGKILDQEATARQAQALGVSPESAPSICIPNPALEGAIYVLDTSGPVPHNKLVNPNSTGMVSITTPPKRRPKLVKPQLKGSPSGQPQACPAPAAQIPLQCSQPPTQAHR